jgi:uncharacterized protein YraI
MEQTMRRFLPPLASALVAGAPAAMAAQTAIVSVDLNMRAGPSTEFPPVAQIPADAQVVLFGCLDGYQWCDVGFEDNRGWVSADYLDYSYRDRVAPIVDYYDDNYDFDVPVISFVIDDYWGTYYRSRPWFGRETYWRTVWDRGDHGRRGDHPRDRDNRADRGPDRDRDRDHKADNNPKPGDHDRDRADRNDRDRNRAERAPRQDLQPKADRERAQNSQGKERHRSADRGPRASGGAGTGAGSGESGRAGRGSRGDIGSGGMQHAPAIGGGGGGRGPGGGGGAGPGGGHGPSGGGGGGPRQ